MNVRVGGGDRENYIHRYIDNWLTFRFFYVVCRRHDSDPRIGGADAEGMARFPRPLPGRVGADDGHGLQAHG